MKKIECIIRASKLESVRDALGQFGIKGMTVSNVLGCGLQKGRTEVYRGTSMSVFLLPKTKIEIVVSDNLLKEIVDLIIKEAYTGKIGDGKIFITNIESAIRIRTGESGEAAI